MTGYHYVRPHTRRTGRRVRGHYQRNPSRAAGGAAGVITLLLILTFSHGAADRQHTTHSVVSHRHSNEAIQSHHRHPAQRGIANVPPLRRGMPTSSGHRLQ